MKRSRKGLGLLLVALALAGCAPLGYYAHLGKGSLALVGRGDRVEKLLRDPETPEELAGRLRLAQEVLDFANSRLGLPAGKKYRKYVDLERDFVVWTVVAAPEFGLEPKTWCFPVAGCVGYRGFFDRDKADRFAARLERAGFDVSVGGVRAFSFLGWFAEPLLNTFVFEADRQLAGLLFHELAHGVLYVKGDTAFNESFATAVEREGVRRWLEAQEEEAGEDPLEAYRRSIELLDRSFAVIAAKREQLETLYRSSPGLSVLEMRRRKGALFAELERELASIDPDRIGAFAAWTSRNLDNADLASIAFYNERVAAFEDLLQAVNRDLDGFYSAASCLASLDSDERLRRLDRRQWSDCILARSWSCE